MVEEVLSKHVWLAVPLMLCGATYINDNAILSYLLFDKNGNMEYLDRGHFGDLDGLKKIDEMSKK